MKKMWDKLTGKSTPPERSGYQGEWYPSEAARSELRNEQLEQEQKAVLQHMYDTFTINKNKDTLQSCSRSGLLFSVGEKNIYEHDPFDPVCERVELYEHERENSRGGGDIWTGTTRPVYGVVDNDNGGKTLSLLGDMHMRQKDLKYGIVDEGELNNWVVYRIRDPETKADHMVAMRPIDRGLLWKFSLD